MIPPKQTDNVPIRLESPLRVRYDVTNGQLTQLFTVSKRLTPNGLHNAKVLDKATKRF